MTANVYYAGAASEWPDYREALTDALSEAGVDAHLSNRADDPAAVDYVVYAPSGPVSDFAPFTGAHAVLSLWAGVERIVPNTTLTQPLARMVDSGMTEGMVEWVTGHVLRQHLGMDDQAAAQARGEWMAAAPPLARNRKVAILGLGELGSACAHALAGLNFDVSGWSRSPKQIDGITCRSGAEGLAETLAPAEIIVLLLPQTPETQGIINKRTIEGMRGGARILNPGRGTLIDDDALIEALDTGKLAHATLDVFRTEPLPADHPYWTHPRVTVTPHIASQTRPETAARTIAENIRRGEAGEPLLYLVDRDRGY